ncbi:MAG: hypothetical protein ACEPO8_13320 [Rhodothermaceae bacterium]
MALAIAVFALGALPSTGHFLILLIPAILILTMLSYARGNEFRGGIGFLLLAIFFFILFDGYESFGAFLGSVLPSAAIGILFLYNHFQKRR